MSERAFAWPTGRGSIPSNYPDLRGMGFTNGEWKHAQGYIDELASLRDRWRKTNARIGELRDELRFQGGQLELQRAEMIRTGDQEPDDKYLVATRKQLEKAEARSRALLRAAETVEGELQQHITEVGEELAGDVEKEAISRINRHQELVAEMQRIESEMAYLRGLRSVLMGEKEIQHYTADFSGGMHWRSEPDEIIPAELLEDSEAIMSTDARALLRALQR